MAPGVPIKPMLAKACVSIPDGLRQLLGAEAAERMLEPPGDAAAPEAGGPGGGREAAGAAPTQRERAGPGGAAAPAEQGPVFLAEYK
jgi:hypothetical protein